MIAEEDFSKIAEYIEKKSYQQLTVDIRDALVLLEKCNNNLVKDRLAIEQISIGWMDNLFRPDNQIRKDKCLELNDILTTKVLNLKVAFQNSYKTISKQGYEEIQKAINQLRKKMPSLQMMSAGIKAILGAAFFAIVVLGALIGTIILGPLGTIVGAIATALIAGAAVGIAYLIVEGLAVDQRYKKMEEVINAYRKAIDDFTKLENDYPFKL